MPYEILVFCQSDGKLSLLTWSLPVTIFIVCLYYCEQHGPRSYCSQGKQPDHGSVAR